MDLRRKANRKWELRWREAGRYASRTFDRKKDAEQFDIDRRRRKQLGQAAIPEDVPLSEFAKTYWRLHAIPNLAESTRDFYARALSNHIIPRLGDYGVRELTPKRLARFRESLERDAGTATVRKAMAILQSILSFAVAEELVEFNAAAAVRKPRYERARDPQILLPAEVERIRSNLASLRDRTLVGLLAYSGPRPEEVVCRLAWEDIGERAIRYRDTKRHRERFTPLLAPLAEDLREWFLASGRPIGGSPVFPAHDGGFWDKDDWSNWRGSVWKSRPERRYKRDGQTKVYRGTVGCGPPGTRPRDLRSSYITLRVYEGVPLTTIAREVGTSVAMIEKHYAGIIENWNGKQTPAERQIRHARAASARSMHVGPDSSRWRR
jgi:integrase